MGGRLGYGANEDDDNDGNDHDHELRTSTSFNSATTGSGCPVARIRATAAFRLGKDGLPASGLNASPGATLFGAGELRDSTRCVVLSASSEFRLFFPPLFLLMRLTNMYDGSCSGLLCVICEMSSLSPRLQNWQVQCLFWSEERVWDGKMKEKGKRIIWVINALHRISGSLKFLRVRCLGQEEVGKSLHFKYFLTSLFRGMRQISIPGNVYSVVLQKRPIQRVILVLWQLRRFTETSSACWCFLCLPPPTLSCFYVG